MSKILVIKSTVINESQSYSTALLNLYINKYKLVNSDDEIIYLDLSELDMANITLNKNNFTTYFNEKDSDKYIDQLKSVNKLIVCTPMFNFNISALLKNYLDHILVANKTFSYKYSKKGDAIGLLTNLKVQIIATQGAPIDWYPFSNFINYLEGLFKFVGAQVNESLLLDGTKVQPLENMSPNEAAETMNLKIEQLVKSF